jgi:hypothetical protein
MPITNPFKPRAAAGSSWNTTIERPDKFYAGSQGALSGNSTGLVPLTKPADATVDTDTSKTTTPITPPAVTPPAITAPTRTPGGGGYAPDPGSVALTLQVQSLMGKPLDSGLLGGLPNWQQFVTGNVKANAMNIARDQLVSQGTPGWLADMILAGLPV